MDKVEETFTQFQNDEVQLDYPDFDAMWGRIEASLPEPNKKLIKVPASAPKWRWLQHRKVAVISSLALLLVAAPVLATVTNKWDSLFNYRSGIQTALLSGLGQNIDQFVINDGVRLTLKTAIVDDNRTVIIYTISSAIKAADYLKFSTMEIKDSHGRVIEGMQSQTWDEASQTWNGYFETDWSPDTQLSDVQFTAKNLQSFSGVKRDIEFNPLSEKTNLFTIKQDGINEVKVESFVQGDQIMLSSAVTYSQKDVKDWTYPSIGVYKDNVNVRGVGTDVAGTPGEQGEVMRKQSFKLADLEQADLQYKLLYTREEQSINKVWAYNLHLDKTVMLSGTIKRTMNVPLVASGARLDVEQMTITPTQIKIKARHVESDRFHDRFPYVNYALDVDGKVLNGGEYTFGKYDPEFSYYRFEIPVGLKLTKQSSIFFVAKYESRAFRDAKEPILLKDISEEEKSLTTLVGGYTVKWTYYKRDGNLYVQSECEDPSFGGVNQTYMGKGADGMSGKQVSPHFSGDGVNTGLDVYKNYAGTDAEIYIFWYYVENPNKEIRVELKE
ncbi:DUF4179 domain-containing protein [Paenibacillus psychroresistens]|nr:DUF4179 domain-containing protein [Paenibacillus psychroresistens]